MLERIGKLFGKGEIYNPMHPDVLKEYNLNRPLGSQPRICYSPFKSLYFGHHGLAHTCCYNRSHVLGTYPKQSIKEIWFGKEAERLRDYISHNDLSLGCQGCKHQMIAGNFDAVKAKQYDERVLNKNGYPSVMEFELSNVCNLECEMCSGEFSSMIRAKRERLPPLEIPYGDDFLDQLREFIPYLEEVKFYGGEPFLIEQYYLIWEMIIEINPSVRISVQTNGTTLNNRVKRILENTNFHINISIDSLEKENYEFIRKNAVLERTLENIQWFREYTKKRNTFFGISVCAMQQNRHELPRFIEFCNELEAPIYFHTIIFPVHCSMRNMDAKDLDETISYLRQFDFPENTPVQLKNKQHYLGLISQIQKWKEDSVNHLRKVKLESFDDLEQVLVRHIMADSATAEEKRMARKDNVVRKIRDFRQSLGDENFGSILSFMDLDNPFLLDDLAFHLETYSVDTLVEMAKNRMN